MVLFTLSQLSLCSGLIRPCSCVSLVGLVALKAGLCVSLLMCLLFSLCFVSSSFRSVSSPLFFFFCLPVLVSWILSLIWFPVFLGLQGVVSPVFELVPLLLVPFPCKKKKMSYAMRASYHACLVSCVSHIMRVPYHACLISCVSHIRLIPCVSQSSNIHLNLPVSIIQHPSQSPSVDHPTSSIQCLVSIQHPSSIIHHPVSSI